MVRAIKIQDAFQIAEIYNYYILNSISTFEESPVSTEEMSQRIQTTITTLPWVVYEEDDQILGYAYASPWKARSAYLHSAEITVYLKHRETNKGLGKKLYSELIQRLKELNYRTIIGGIALPNDASIALHEKLRFEKVAHFKKVGFKFNRWIDVGYWQLLVD
jgi:L-amino acid N-acyltransferase YncA